MSTRKGVADTLWSRKSFASLVEQRRKSRSVDKSTGQSARLRFYSFCSTAFVIGLSFLALWMTANGPIGTSGFVHADDDIAPAIEELGAESFGSLRDGAILEVRPRQTESSVDVTSGGTFGRVGSVLIAEIPPGREGGVFNTVGDRLALEGEGVEHVAVLLRGVRSKRGDRGKILLGTSPEGQLGFERFVEFPGGEGFRQAHGIGDPLTSEGRELLRAARELQGHFPLDRAFAARLDLPDREESPPQTQRERLAEQVEARFKKFLIALRFVTAGGAGAALLVYAENVPLIPAIAAAFLWGNGTPSATLQKVESPLNNWVGTRGWQPFSEAYQVNKRMGVRPSLPEQIGKQASITALYLLNLRAVMAALPYGEGGGAIRPFLFLGETAWYLDVLEFTSAVSVSLFSKFLWRQLFSKLSRRDRELRESFGELDRIVGRTMTGLTAAASLTLSTAIIASEVLMLLLGTPGAVSLVGIGALGGVVKLMGHERVIDYFERQIRGLASGDHALLRFADRLRAWGIEGVRMVSQYAGSSLGITFAYPGMPTPAPIRRGGGGGGRCAALFGG